MLLNVGPNAKGEIPKESLDILEVVGKWMDQNSESIHECRMASQLKPEWGRYTQKGNKLYAHVFEESVGPINLKGLAGRVRKARLLSDGSELPVTRPWNVTEFPDDALVNFSVPAHFSFPLPDEKDTVIELELSEE